MIQAKIVITVNYPEGSQMEDARKDEKDFLNEICFFSYWTGVKGNVTTESTVVETEEIT
jgi:hypothetical protein